MSSASQCLLRLHDERFELEDYQSGVPRWCSGCGDNAILAAVQRLCRDEQLKPERTVFVSGIGCSSRFPHYMKTYGFHGIHGRALPIAEGVRLARPDLHVFVNTGDGDCCSIGAAHWIHALRYNMNLTVMLHDNQIYGLTKMQASPTSPIGLKSNTTPKGSYLDALNPLTVTLGVTNVSFVAQAVDWIPELLYEIIHAGFKHKGLAFIRIIQRCPEWLPKMLDAYVQDPERTLILHHDNGVQLSSGLAQVYKNRIEHDPKPAGQPVQDLGRRTSHVEQHLHIGKLVLQGCECALFICQEPVEEGSRYLVLAIERGGIHREVCFGCVCHDVLPSSTPRPACASAGRPQLSGRGSADGRCAAALPWHPGRRRHSPVLRRAPGATRRHRAPRASP